MIEAEGAATFRTATDMYGRFVGRYAPSLAVALIRTVGVEPDSRVLDVGCGPGGLATALAEIVGQENVAAVDPSQPFVSVCRARLPTADVRVAAAEELPFEDDSFDAAFAQLVVNFMTDPVRGVEEMRRVVRPSGSVAACTWDYRDGMTMIRAYWDAAHEVAPDEAAEFDEGKTMRYAALDELTGLWQTVDLEEVEGGELSVTAAYEDFEDLWAPLPTGIGPAGAFCASLDPERRQALRAALSRKLGDPEGPFELSARAWYAVGRV
ncbi:MAG TPA: methyltransferase domain-containing protein [Gaiellaceae bacterium]|nr:methyltransferase domain-containing protein [Gaiellaceae bacterium]